MYKEINFDGYNRAKIIKIYENGDVLCDLECVESNGSVSKRDTSISFPANKLPFELTPEEIEDIINPQQLDSWDTAF